MYIIYLLFSNFIPFGIEMYNRILIKEEIMPINSDFFYFKIKILVQKLSRY